MTRYILIENNSGYVWADTADLGGPARDETPAEACKRIDETLDARLDEDLVYEEHGPNYIPSGDAYFVYRAADDFQNIDDGSRPDAIKAVEDHCKLVAVVTSAPSPNAADEWILTKHL